MKKLSDDIVYFFKNQGFAIVSTLDPEGNIHCSAKGIVGIEKEGKVFVVDLYMQKTFNNLKKDPRISITAIDEREFIGFTLQGKAKIIPAEEMGGHLIDEWEKKIINRISKRVVKSVQKYHASLDHFEAKLPSQPQYLIEIDVESIIDLTPIHLKAKAD